MDRIAPVFIEDVVRLLDSPFDTLPEPLDLLSSSWGRLAKIEYHLCKEMLQFHFWIDSSGTPRFYVKRNDIHVDIDRIGSGRISRVGGLRFGVDQEVENSHVLNGDNLQRLCKLFAKNVCTIHVKLEMLGRFDLNVVSALLLSLSRIAMLDIWIAEDNLVTRVLRHAVQRGTLIEFDRAYNSVDQNITPEVLDLLCSLVSSPRFHLLGVVVAPTSPIPVEVCVERIVESLENNAAKRSLYFYTSQKRIFRIVKERLVRIQVKYWKDDHYPGRNFFRFLDQT